MPSPLSDSRLARSPARSARRQLLQQTTFRSAVTNASGQPLAGGGIALAYLAIHRFHAPLDLRRRASALPGAIGQPSAFSPASGVSLRLV